MSTPILRYQPGGGPGGGSGTIGQRNGYLYYWPDIENLTGTVPQTDLEAQDISVLPSESLIIVVTGVDGDETHWRRMPDASSPVTELGLGIIVPINYDNETRPWVLVQELTEVGGGGGTNAFGIVTVGATNIVAESALDTLNLIAGTNITLTPDALADSIMIAASGGGGSGTSMSSIITQTGHGFAVGNVLKYTGTAYAKALADVAANAEVVGLVSAVADANNFTLTTGGAVTGLSGLTAGSVYFLSTTSAGLLTTSATTIANQVSKPLLVATSATDGYFFNWRGWVVNEAVTGEGGAVYSQAGTTQLIEGQAYVDVVFGSIQTDDEWVLVECIVVNELDGAPLNIWPGIITDKTAAGFRLQLNGLPDSGNYYLHWAVSGVNILPVPATLYLLSGPTSGPIGAASTFTVSLAPSTTLAGPATVTPSDGGGGGTFAPTSVVLTSGSPMVTFTYTPASYGAKTISVTNDFTLIDPVAIVFTPTAATYTFSGPSGGAESTTSTAFTVALPVGAPVSGTVTVTPHDGGAGGTFSPTTVGLTTGAPSTTFTYTPLLSGAKTLSVTNNRGLSDPGNLTYTVIPFDPSTLSGLKLWLKADALVLADGASVSTWTDSSGLGNNFAASGTAPIYKTAIVNSKPVVRFNGSTQGLASTTANIVITPTTHYIIIAVLKAASISGGAHDYMVFGDVAPGPSNYFRRTVDSFDHIQNAGGGGFPTVSDPGGVVAGAWNVVSTDWDGTNLHLWRNSVLKGTTAAVTMGSGPLGGSIGFDAFDGNISYWDGDIAEIVIYDSALSSTDRTKVENYLKTKYGL